MSAKYIMLECNRLRSLEIQQREQNDIYKNKWSNVVSSSGIVINKGDVINCDQVIVNTKGATDEVLEFTGGVNTEGYVDNKTKLNYSFYVNNSGRNSVPLPFNTHPTYVGIGKVYEPTLTNLTNAVDGITTINTDNGPIPNLAQIQEMLSRRSLGEFLFTPMQPDDINHYPQWVGGNAHPDFQQYYIPDWYKQYFNGNYLFRLSTLQTGIGLEGNSLSGYFAGNIYPARRQRKEESAAILNHTGAAGQKLIKCQFDSRFVVGNLIQSGVFSGTTYGTVESIVHDTAHSFLTLVANIPSALPITLYANSNPVPANDVGLETGISIKILTTTGPATNPPNQVMTWQVQENDTTRYNSVNVGDVLMLSVKPDGVPDPTNNAEEERWQTFTVHAIPDVRGFTSRNCKNIDGERYFQTNLFYSGLANQTEETLDGVVIYGDVLDFQTLNPTLDKRYGSCDLEIKPSFATPDNIGSILTDQLHEPNKLTNNNPIDDFFDLSQQRYSFIQRTPNGKDLGDIKLWQEAYQSNLLLRPDDKPVIVSTPTYKPNVANMYGWGMPSITWDSTTGEKRQSFQGSFAGMRRRFYNSVCYKDMDRVVSLKNAFYNFDYEIEGESDIQWNRDIYVGTELEAYLHTVASNAKIYGDFGTIATGSLGTRVCLLNCWNNVEPTKELKVPKNSLIITNMKFTENNLKRLSESFRISEQYLGDLSKKADVTSDDYNRHLAVNLDIQMYDDQRCNPSDLLKTAGFDGLPENFLLMAHQRNKFCNSYEIDGLTNACIAPVDWETGFENACIGFQRDFTANDRQQLSSIWIKSRWQDGFKYNQTLDSTYTGDTLGGIAEMLAQQKAEKVYYSTGYSESNLNNLITPIEGTDYQYVYLTDPSLGDGHTNNLIFSSDWKSKSPYRDGMTIICTGGTIDELPIVGRTSIITEVDLESDFADPTKPYFKLVHPFGFVSDSARDITIKILDPPDDAFFNKNSWSDDGVNSRDMGWVLEMQKKYNIAAVPLFQPVTEQNIRISGSQFKGAVFDDVPLIAFVSVYELGKMNIKDFDKVNLANPNNKWGIDFGNSRTGSQLGFDPSFTRNDAIAISNISVGNDDPAKPDSYANYMYVGAVNPSINFNPDLSRFEFSGLNTPITTGNGLPSDIPQNLIASSNPEQQVYEVHKIGRIHQARPHLQGDIVTNVNALGDKAYAPIYNQFTSVQKFDTILDSQSGIAIESLTLYDNVGQETKISYQDTDKYNNTLLSKLGFTLDQLLISVGSEQAFFVNNFVFQDIFTYEKSLSNFVKPITTGAYISSAEIQPLSLNEMSMPLFNLGIDTIVRSAAPDCSQSSITAFNLPQKLDYPYLVVYCSIPEGCSNTEFIGGSDSQSLIPAVAYLYRNESNGDFFYGLQSDITFTAVKDYVLSQVDIDIRKPDGSRPRLADHSAIIFKITKPLNIPDPELILGKKK